MFKIFCFHNIQMRLDFLCLSTVVTTSQFSSSSFTLFSSQLSNSKDKLWLSPPCKVWHRDVIRFPSASVLNWSRVLSAQKSYCYGCVCHLFKLLDSFSRSCATLQLGIVLKRAGQQLPKTLSHQKVGAPSHSLVVTISGSLSLPCLFVF